MLSSCTFRSAPGRASRRRCSRPEDVNICTWTGSEAPSPARESSGSDTFVTSISSTPVSSVEFDENAFKFAIVRSPFDRAISLFHRMQRMGLLPKSTSFGLFSTLLREQRYEDIGLFNVSGLSQCNPQAKWLVNDSGDVVADMIGRFENLDPFLDVLRDRKIIEGDFPRLNSSSVRSDFDYYYEAKWVRENIEIAYRLDFETFNY